jgi:hypothetical protein
MKVRISAEELTTNLVFVVCSHFVSSIRYCVTADDDNAKIKIILHENGVLRYNNKLRADIPSIIVIIIFIEM